MKLGIIDIEKLYLGDTEVKKAYLGTNQVYSAETPHDYSNDYLTIVSLVDNNKIYWHQDGSTSSRWKKTISVSTDNGQTWINYTSAYKSGTYTTLATLNTGDKLLIKGNNTYYSDTYGPYNCFKSTGLYNAEGNVMSLIYGDNFIGQTAFTNTNCSALGGLFYNSTTLNDVSNLILPATTLTNSCYKCMFYGCNKITTAPELPATTQIMWCYYQMFYNCSNLNYIKCLLNSVNNANTNNWVSGVAATGTFVKNPLLSSWPTGTSGVPSGWTIVDAS